MGSNLGKEAVAAARGGQTAGQYRQHACGDAGDIPRDRSGRFTPKDSPPFINSAVEVETSLSPEELLHELLHIERDLGRTRRCLHFVTPPD